MARLRRLAFWLISIAVPGAIVSVLAARTLSQYQKQQPVMLSGAVMRQDSDATKASPIAGVDVDAANGLALHGVRTDFNGLFRLPLRPGVTRGEDVTLTFRDPDYQPLDFNESDASRLYVVRMMPVHVDDVPAQSDSTIFVGNVVIRYSNVTTASNNIGTAAKMFLVTNTGNVPCPRGNSLCSPDRRWKAAVGSASLDAGPDNVFENARLSCIAGPCPFTRIDSDNFSQGGRTISAVVRDWSDTTTFLLQAEAIRLEITNVVRTASPVILGDGLNFTLPPGAQGPSIEAELNGDTIVFPLERNITLSWADCDVRTDEKQTKLYRCELKPGYRFR